MKRESLLLQFNQWAENCRERRFPLIHQMNSLKSKGVDCSHCSGVCCTFIANSMKVTPIETIDIFVYLYRNSHLSINLFLETLFLKMNKTIKDFRLDSPLPGNGKRDFIRRTYTCPLFENKKLGCLLYADYRPYGCLGFNPRHSSNVEGENCGSDQKFLIQRDEVLSNEQSINQQIVDLLKIDFNKEYLPIAIVKIVSFLTLSKN